MIIRRCPPIVPRASIASPSGVQRPTLPRNAQTPKDPVEILGTSTEGKEAFWAFTGCRSCWCVLRVPNKDSPLQSRELGYNTKRQPLVPETFSVLHFLIETLLGNLELQCKG
ncbi:uncharacterized protein [Physcomitrium patens]|uniref:Uncharacterized protein n=1 Tax=Physcomitrium patens TaxID=3218 RepID=A0A2K1K0F0_PHYPA|nr:hypothetical protein PHYPA_014382 [Physcomitrium patens]